MKRLVLLLVVAISMSAYASPVAAKSLASQETSVPGGWLLMAAYMVLWLAILAYLLFLAIRQQRLSRDIRDLERRLDDLLDLD